LILGRRKIVGLYRFSKTEVHRAHQTEQTFLTRSSNRRDATAEIAAQIVEFVGRSALEPGTHLPAQDLADRFNTSRPVINRALERLHRRSAVVHEPNRGYFVGKIAADVAVQEGDKVYRQLAADRLSGKLDNVVTETDLRHRYGLTQSKLAALLSRIAREGWIERRPGYGWTFTEILTTPNALAQTFRLRLAVEPAALLEPGYRLDRDMAEQCQRVEEKMLREGIEGFSRDTLFARGAQFHETIVAGSRNPYFFDVIRRTNRLRRLLSSQTVLDHKRYLQQSKEHLEILRLLERGRNREASRALRRHLEGVKTSYERLFNLPVSGEVYREVRSTRKTDKASRERR
jgi:DNA-binding GntR family transcriptional regulator